jgi:NAD(P)H dehydrogenase (quinone)
MVKISILYYSKTGKTKEMAELMAESMIKTGGVQAKAMAIDAIDKEFLAESKTVVFGTPTYYANCAWQIKKWFDEDSAKNGYNLAGKLGAAFATANVPQGGADIANLTMLQHMLVKGMIVYSGGTTHGQPFLHIGAAAWRDTFEKDKELIKTLGERLAAKTKELFA